MAIELSDLRKQIQESLQTSIQEALTDIQKLKVDRWDQQRPSHVQESIDKVFNGKDRIVLPLETESDAEPHPDVIKHLATHGYSIKDYQKGHAEDKYGRTVSIGKALVKTGAHKDTVSSFVNDPNRSHQDSPHKDLRVVISHHPHDVTGMSTGCSWSSCMDIEKGSSKDFLPAEVKAGTHVAYLTHKDDVHALAQPLARIALKPFHEGGDETTPPVFRGEHEVYGQGPSSFQDTVNAWAEKNYPIEHGKTYIKNSYVYDDTGDELTHHTDEELLQKQSKDRSLIPAITPVHQVDRAVNLGIDKFKETGDKSFLKNTDNINSRFAKPKTVNRFYDNVIKDKTHSPTDTKSFLRKQGHRLNKTNLDHAVDHNVSHLSDDVMRNPHIKKGHIDKLDNEFGEGALLGSSFAASVGMQAPHMLTDEHVNRVIKDVHSGDMDYVPSTIAENMSAEHVKKLMNHPQFGGMKISHEHTRFVSAVKPEHLNIIRDKILEDPNGNSMTTKNIVLNRKPEIDMKDIDLVKTEPILASTIQKLTHKATPEAFKEITKTFNVLKIPHEHEKSLTNEDYDDMNNRHVTLLGDSDPEAHVRMLEAKNRSANKKDIADDISDSLMLIHHSEAPHKTSDSHIDRIQHVVDSNKDMIGQRSTYDLNETIQRAKRQKKMYLADPLTYES